MNARAHVSTRPFGAGTRRGRVAIATVAALALLAAGCGGDNGDAAESTTTSAGAASTAASATTTAGGSASTAGATTTAAGAGQDDRCTAARKGGELTLSAFFMTRSFDPVISTGSGTTGSVELAAVYDMLIRWDAETRTFEPKLAKSLEPNADHTQWTLELRPEAVFGNGDPVDAAAVKGSIERHLSPNNFSTVFVDSQVISQIEVAGPYKLVFHLKAPWGTFPFYLSDMAGLVVNPKVFAPGRDDAHGTAPTGAGAGPYEVTRFAPGEEIVLQLKKNWWGEAVYGPTCIETVRIVDIPTTEATFSALELGEIDMMFERDSETIAKIRAAGYDSFWEFSHAGAVMMVYSADPARITSDPRIRQALQYAVNVDTFDERVYAGTGRPTSSIIDAESPVAPDIKGLPYDPEKARQLVEQVKAEGWDGRIQLIQQNINTEPGITLEAMFEAVGFDVDVQNLPPNDAIARIYVNQDYDVGIGGSSLHDASPIVTLDRFWGANNRYTGFRDPAFAAALEEVRAAATDAEMKAALTKVQQIWNEQVPSVLLNIAEQGMAWRDNVHGVYFSDNGVGFFDRAYVDK